MTKGTQGTLNMYATKIEEMKQSINDKEAELEMLNDA